MSRRYPVVLALAAAALVTHVRCGGGAAPTQPQSPPSPVATPTPAPTPTPGLVLPPGMSCVPAPPPLYGIKVKIQQDSGNRKVLDSKPLVLNVDGYCARVGSGGETQKFCETRLEDHPDRTACDYLVTGIAADTGRWGPSWTRNGQLCNDANFANCVNHPDNQFLLIAKSPGEYIACAAPEVPVAPGGSACGSLSIE